METSLLNVYMEFTPQGKIIQGLYVLFIDFPGDMLAGTYISLFISPNETQLTLVLDSHSLLIKWIVILHGTVKLPVGYPSASWV